MFCFGIVKDAVRLIYILEQFGDMLVHFHSLETVSGKSARAGSDPNLAIGLVGEGYMSILDGKSLEDMKSG